MYSHSVLKLQQLHNCSCVQMLGGNAPPGRNGPAPPRSSQAVVHDEPGDDSFPELSILSPDLEAHWRRVIL